MKLIRIFLCICLLLAQSALAETSPVRIGALIVLTGQYAMQGNAFREGIELAVEEINARGGIVGRPLEVLPEDTANLPVQALTAARKLLQVEGLVAAITTSYPELATGAAEFTRRRIPVVHLWDSSPEIEAMGEYLFGIGPWTPSAGEVAALFASRNLRAKTAVTFRVVDPFSELVTGYFEQVFRSHGGKVLESYAFNPHEQDFRSVFAKVRAHKPDVIYSPVGDNILSFYTQLRQQISDVPVISSDVIAEEHITQAPKVFEEIYQTQMMDPTGPAVEALASAYTRKFKKPMRLSWFVATAYDGTNLIANCVKQVGTDPSAIKDCISKTKGFFGVSQQLSFNSGGSSPQIARVFQIRKGSFEHEPLRDAD
jgi:branched-chain amino acid transport system substrate-binding protein